MKYKLFTITALMENGTNEPITLSFDLPAMDENGIGQTISKMDSIIKVLSVVETTPTIKGQVYDEKM